METVFATGRSKHKGRTRRELAADDSVDGEVKDAVQEEIKFRTPELKSTLSDAAQTVTQQVKESAGRVKEEAKQAAKQSSAGRDPGA